MKLLSTLVLAASFIGYCVSAGTASATYDRRAEALAHRQTVEAEDSFHANGVGLKATVTERMHQRFDRMAQRFGGLTAWDADIQTHGMEIWGGSSASFLTGNGTSCKEQFYHTTCVDLNCTNLRTLRGMNCIDEAGRSFRLPAVGGK